MPSISIQPNRAYQNIPDVSDDPATQKVALQTIKDALQTHERRDNNYLKSFIRFEELVELGIIDESGEFVLDLTASGSANALDDLSDVTISSLVNNRILGYDLTSAMWTEQSAGDLNLSEIGHTHVVGDIVGLTDLEFDDLTDVELTGAQIYDLLFRDIDGDWKPTAGGLSWDGDDLYIAAGDINFYGKGDTVTSAIRQGTPLGNDLSIEVTLGDLVLSPFGDVEISDGADLVLYIDNAINWLDSSSASVELLTLAGGEALEGDPEFALVSILVPLTGANGSTVATDLSNNAHGSATFHDNASISDAVLRYGENTLLLTGAADHIYWASDPGFTIGQDPADGGATEIGNFTLEIDVYFSGDPGTSNWTFASKYDTTGSERHWLFRLEDGDTAVLRVTENGSGATTYPIGSWDPVAGQWYTICFEMEWNWSDSTPDRANFYVDGVLTGSSSSIGGRPNMYQGTVSPLRLGCWEWASAGVGDAEFFVGHMANLRITKDFARYKGVSYTPPTGPYPTGVNPVGGDTFVVGDPTFPTYIDGTLVGLKNNIGINWEDSAGTDVELLVFDSIAAGEDAGNVIFMSHFNGDNGATTAVDETGNFVMEFKGNAALSTADPKFGTASALMTALHPSVVVIDDAFDPILDFGSGDFTLEGWFKSTDGTPNIEILMGRWGTATGFSSWYIYVVNGTTLRIEMCDGTNRNQIDGTGTDWTDLGWHHVAYVRDGDTIRIYFDGVQLTNGSGTLVVPGSSMNYPTNPGNEFETVIGGYYRPSTAGYGNLFNGEADDVRFTKGICRYPDGTTFTVPSAEFVFAGSDTFVVGDPLILTVIDGLTVNITSAATDIDGTLNVDGAVTFITTLNAQGAVDFDDTLIVDGAVTFVTTLNAQGAVDFDDTLIVDGAVTFITTLNAQGAVDFDDTLNVDGEASFQDDVSLSATSAINFDISEVAAFTPEVPEVPEVPAAAGGDTDWASVSLLADFDGADAATSYTSIDDGARVATFVADAQLDTAQSKYGTASLLLDGTGDYVTFPDSADYDFGSGDFTIECDVRFNGDPGGAGADTFIGKWDADGVSERSWLWSLVANKLRFLTSTNGIAVTNDEFDWNPVGDTWYNVVVVRHGSDLRAFIDGVQVGATITNSVTIFDGASPLYIGAASTGAGLGEELNGWIDNVRVTKGVARYTTTFQPPTGAHPDEDTYWGSVALQLDFEDVDAATVAIDASDPTRVSTFFGTAAIDNTQAKFGSTSFFGDGNSDYLTFPDSDEWHFGAGDFTIECWAYLNDASNIEFWVNHYDSSILEAAWAFGYDGVTDNIKFLTSSNGSGVATLSSDTYVPATGEWIHFAASRTGGKLYMFANGVTLYEAANTTNLYNASTPLYIGALHGGAGIIHHHDGWIDEPRITKGIGRYGANFTPPTEAHAEEGDDDWASVALLANFDGADAATSYTSEDDGLRVATFAGTAQLDTAQFKYGTASLLLDGNSDYVTFPDDPQWDLAGDDFTVECWIRHNTHLNIDTYIAHYDSGGGSFQSWIFRYDAGSSGRLQFAYSTSGAGSTALSSSTWNPTNGVWHHVAVSRHGGVLRMFADGVQIYSAAFTATIFSVNLPLDIGTVHGGSGVANFMDGWIDDVRITKGVGRYTSDFTPPEQSFDEEDSNWGAVALLTNFDGDDAATTYTSEDGGERTATFVADAQLDTAQFKFGTASLLLDGTGDYVTFPDSVDWDLGAGDFTIEAWVRHDSISGLQYYVAHYDINGVGEASWAFAWSPNTPGLFFVSSALGTGDIVVTTSTTTWTPTVGVWYHVCATRTSGQLRMFVDGAKKLDAAVATDLFDAATPLYIGCTSGGSGPVNYMDGWIDEVRVTKGVSRYTAAFTPPVAVHLRGTPPGADATPAVPAVPGIFIVGDPLLVTQIDGLTAQVTGDLEFLGKLNTNVTTAIITTHIAGDEHVILVDDDAAGATVTVTLPPAATALTMYHIKKLGTTASVIVEGDGAETIDGAATAVLTIQYESIMLVSDGSTWHVI